MKFRSLNKLNRLSKKWKKEARKRKRMIKKFKKYNFPEEMINDLNDYFNKHNGCIEFYINYSYFDLGIKHTEIYQIFKKYGKEKLLCGGFNLFKRRIDFPLVWNIQENMYHLDLGD